MARFRWIWLLHKKYSLIGEDLREKAPLVVIRQGRLHSNVYFPYYPSDQNFFWQLWCFAEEGHICIAFILKTSSKISRECHHIFHHVVHHKSTRNDAALLCVVVVVVCMGQENSKCKIYASMGTILPKKGGNLQYIWRQKRLCMLHMLQRFAKYRTKTFVFRQNTEGMNTFYDVYCMKMSRWKTNISI